ncbi:hypothetical protein ACPZ19_12045 [Amycolatopsis lurida]
MSFDTGAYHDADRFFQFAVACADERGNWARRAMTLATMARQTLWINQPDRALTFVDYALVRSDRLAPSRQAMLHAIRAQTLAAMRRTQEAVREVGIADQAFSRSAPGDADPSWTRFYTEAQHAGETANALANLCFNGSYTAEARARFTTAFTGHDVNYARSRAIVGLKLATLLMVTEDPSEAAALGAAAVKAAEHVRSARLSCLMRNLHGQTGRHPRIPIVQDLRSQLANQLSATSGYRM